MNKIEKFNEKNDKTPNELEKYTAFRLQTKNITYSM